MNTRTNLIFKIKEKLNQRSSIRVYYVHESNQAQFQDCRVRLNNIIQCLSPSFGQIGKVNVLFTINEGSYADAGQTLQIYSEKTIVFLHTPLWSWSSKVNSLRMNHKSWLNTQTAEISLILLEFCRVINPPLLQSLLRFIWQMERFPDFKLKFHLIMEISFKKQI
jgi:hypothetical protein